MMMSLSSLLWAHALVMGLQFVEMVRGEDMAVTSTRHRIFTNRMRTFIKVHYAAWLAALISVIALYEAMGSLWVVLAVGIGTWAGLLTLAMLMLSLWLRSYIPGMVSGIGFFALRVLLIRDHVGSGALQTSSFLIAILLGVLMAIGMLISVLLLHRREPGPSG